MRAPQLLASIVFFAAAGFACSSSNSPTPTPIAASTITGKVVLTGVSDASGVALTAVGPVIAAATSAADGAFSFTKLQAGTYSITAAVGDSREHTLLTSVTVANTLTADAGTFTFTLLGAVTGKATKAGATDHSGIAVGVLGQSATALTDAQGNYRLDGVLLGAQILSASAAGFQTTTAAVTVARGSTAAAALSLAAGATAATTSVSGKVLLGVADQSGVFVTASGPTMAAATTAADGTYAFAQLAQGTYFITARVGDSVEGQRTVLVTAGAAPAKAADLSFTLVGTVLGKAVKQGQRSTDQSGILVGLLGTDLTSLTDASGAYRFDGVLLGAHALSATATGYSPAAATVTASRGTTTAPELDLAPIAPSLSALGVTVVGSGRVLSAPAGLSCANTCSANFATGSTVVLFAEPSPGYVFGSWSVPLCTAPFCPVTLSADQQVTATFLLEPITASAIGPGRGSVQFTSAPGGATRLIPVPEPGYTFVGWRGACTGLGECVLSGGAVQAAFTEVFYWTYQPGTVLNGTSLLGTNTELISSLASLSAYTYGFSNDGLAVLYVSNLSEDFTSTGLRNLWAIDLVTREANPLTHYNDSVYLDSGMPPSFSPDGTLAAFISNQSPTSTEELAVGYSNLFTVKRDGTGVKAVTPFVNGELSLADHPFSGPSNRAYGWSPDGKKLAFAAQYPAGEYGNLFTANVDGSGLTQVTHFASSTIEGDPQPSCISWSPDGTKLAFVSTLRPGEGGPPTSATGNSNVWTVKLADGGLTPVTFLNNTASVGDALYSRTDNTIVYQSADGELSHNTVSVINDDGTGARELFASRNYVAAPVWYVDGTTVLFESSEPTSGANSVNGTHIWQVSTAADAGSAQTVTQSPDARDYTYDDDDYNGD